MTFNPLNAVFNFAIEHTAIGASVTFGLYITIPKYWIYGVLIFLIIILLKEIFFDPTYEKDKPFLWSGVTDFTWYVFGVLIAIAIIYFL